MTMVMSQRDGGRVFRGRNADTLVCDAQRTLRTRVSAWIPSRREGAATQSSRRRKEAEPSEGDWNEHERAVTTLHARRNSHSITLSPNEPTTRNQCSECGSGLSAPTESDAICRGSRGAEAPSTFSGVRLLRFMAL